MPFVSFEGIDGSGKSTQARLLADWLTARGEPVKLTKEPDGGRLGPAVRAMLVDSRNAGALSAVEELLLISAARYDHVRSVIAPALAEGVWVISDRFFDSTFAIQMFETGLEPALFEIVTRAAVGGVAPDLTFILDLPPDLARQRRNERAGLKAADPAEDYRDFARIRRGLQAVAQQSPHRCKLIDASVSDEGRVAAAVRAVVEDAKVANRSAIRFGASTCVQ